MRLLPTTVVGSYPQPDWLVDKAALMRRAPPRVRAKEVWRVAEPYLEEAQDDATRLAIADMERAGVDIITDGEIRRESYSNRFATELEGFDVDRPAQRVGRSGLVNDVPRIVGRIRRRGPVEVYDAQFLRAHSGRTIKITVPGPFTMAQQAQDEFYKDDAALMMDLAAAVNEELCDLVRAGADVVQIDEPYLQAAPDEARRFALPAIDRALEGIDAATALHVCFGYAYVHPGERPKGYSFLPELADTRVKQISIEAAQPKLDLGILRELADKTIILGVISLGDMQAETPALVADRIRQGLEFLPPERLVPAPDCGMKFISRELAFAKLKAMAAGAEIVRRELGLETSAT